MLKKIIFLLSLTLLASCATPHEGPMIYISNASVKPIKNVKCRWASKHVLSLPNLNPGETRSQSFYINSEAEFFGLIQISWSNDNDRTVSREFFLRKTSLPSINDPKTYNYVQLYLDSDYVDVTTSDSPDITGKAERMDKMLNLYHEQYVKENNITDPKQLISVQPSRNFSFTNILY